ncbi:DNA alkylation repair enzyme [Sphingomonas paucimobilis]|nr:DNA alkylation repair enzyme [Sphingomonas paucimobilis]
MTDKTAPALLKDILGLQTLTIIADVGASVSSRFDRGGFLGTASDGLNTLSIMERVRRIADALHAALPARYVDALEIIRAMAPQLTHGLQAVAVTEFLARYGLGDFDKFMNALADLTRFGSAEFAIRPFLAQDAGQTLAVMEGWTSHADEHVRRLASEGSRPRLPWAARIGSASPSNPRHHSVGRATLATERTYGLTIIRLAVMMYVRFPLSLRNVEELLFERGIDISYETVRYWWNRFGPLFAADIRSTGSAACEASNTGAGILTRCT